MYLTPFFMRAVHAIYSTLEKLPKNAQSRPVRLNISVLRNTDTILSFFYMSCALGARGFLLALFAVSVTHVCIVNCAKSSPLVPVEAKNSRPPRAGKNLWFWYPGYTSCS